MEVLQHLRYWLWTSFVWHIHISCLCDHSSFSDCNCKSFPFTVDDISSNVLLLRNVFLGSAPMQPTVAFLLHTLDLYRQTQRICPKFSIQGQVRVFCHMHNVNALYFLLYKWLIRMLQIPYQDYLADQFLIVYNVYLEIIYQMELHMDVILQLNTENWWMLYSCPACCYKLEGETSLKFSLLCKVDGNNSLKRTASKMWGANYRETEDYQNAQTPTIGCCQNMLIPSKMTSGWVCNGSVLMYYYWCHLWLPKQCGKWVNGCPAQEYPIQFLTARSKCWQLPIGNGWACPKDIVIMGENINRVWS